ncbi:MAG: rhamnogalacturonan acetylesterase [Acidobacteriaceae bacterium]
MSKRTVAVAVMCGVLAAGSAFAQAAPGTGWDYTCGKARGATALAPTSVYVTGASFGFDLQTVPRVAKGVCSSDRAFFFSQTVPEGNYRVELVLGGGPAAVTTVKAEARRLMLEAIATPKGKTETRVFIVNIRTPEIGGDNAGVDKKVRLKPSEIGSLDWDNKLTLEFNGTNPSVKSISIKKVEDVPTVYLAGDSTMVDQDKEPWTSWGQMLPRFFNTRPGGPLVSIANNAESGETIASFQGENRFAKIFSTIRSGDYLFIQFAHNDQKPGSGFVPIPQYTALMTKYVEDAKKLGAHPVLVTAMNRRAFDDQGRIQMTLGDYPQATRDVAKAEDVPLIDLNAMSKTLFEAMGPQGTLKAFVHYPANTFPGQTKALADNTHFNSYGAYEIAKCIVLGIQQDKLPLAQDLAKSVGTFDPAHPDNAATWSLPVSPMVSIATPYGR